MLKIGTSLLLGLFLVPLGDTAMASNAARTERAMSNSTSEKPT